VRQYLPVSQLKNPVATTVATTWEAVPASTTVNHTATVAMTTTVSNLACKIKSSRKMLHYFVYGRRMKVSSQWQAGPNVSMDALKKYENIGINLCIKATVLKIYKL
jgi:hypothetical protein